MLLILFFVSFNYMTLCGPFTITTVHCSETPWRVLQLRNVEENNNMEHHDLNEKEHVDALHLQIRAELAAREEVEVGKTSVSVSRLV